MDEHLRKTRLLLNTWLPTTLVTATIGYAYWPSPYDHTTFVPDVQLRCVDDGKDDETDFRISPAWASGPLL